MKTPDSRPRFQSATRHYHRHRETQRDWNDWIEPAKKPASRRRKPWVAVLAAIVAAAAACLWAFALG